jgi:putative transcriptional regulator
VSLHTNVKERRVALGLTQEQLAEKVGVRRETVVFLEAGKYNPSLKLAMDVARVLGASVEDLFRFED